MPVRALPLWTKRRMPRPLFRDCQQIVENITGDPTSTWTSGVLGHHAILEYGGCMFSVQSKKVLDCNLVFKVES